MAIAWQPIVAAQLPSERESKCATSVLLSDCLIGEVVVH